MKVKKTKLPENLYHYTSLIKYRMISATGKLVLTPSNLKYDGATFHQEPLYFNGHEIGIKAVSLSVSFRCRFILADFRQAYPLCGAVPSPCGALASFRKVLAVWISLAVIQFY